MVTQPAMDDIALPELPRDPALDGTFSLVREGYVYIWNRCQRLHTEAFRTRIFGRPTVCVHGREAAQLFYDDRKLQRSGAIPRRVVTSLFGKHAIHTLDDAAHRHRKAAFLSLMRAERLERLLEEMARQWRWSIQQWQRAGSIRLFDEAQRLLTRASCTWAGVRIEE